jgi:tetratricopeptide (TPR) repeat protein
MTPDLPDRPRQHRREDISRRTFEYAVPDTWTIEWKGVREYGVDGVGEIFDGDSTTGLTFNVQLKGTDSAPATKVTIKTSTRNYWTSLGTPTLVVLVDADETIRYRWAHNLDTYGRRRDAASYQFELPTVWGGDSVHDIEREVRAARASRRLRSHLPVFWSVEYGDEVATEWRVAFTTHLERTLAGSEELTRLRRLEGWAALNVSVQPDVISMRLRGTPGGVLHFSSGAVDSYPVEQVAADVFLGLAKEVDRGGLDGVVVDLIEAAIQDSTLLGAEPDATAFAATRIAESGRVGSAAALLERVYFDHSRQFGFIVPATFADKPGRLTDAAITRLAESIARHAPGVEDPQLAGTFYYNAGNLIRRWNGTRASDLYDQSAALFPEYVDRGYWWRERGQICFDSGDLNGAIAAYERADKLGDEQTIPLLADSFAMAGYYRAAIPTWNRMRNVSRYLWVAKFWALDYLADELSLESQERDAARAESLYGADAPGTDVLQADALHFWGLWRAAAQRRESGQPGAFRFYFAAAAFATSVPVLWFEALAAVEGVEDLEQRSNLSAVILFSAVQECGDEFRYFVMQDKYVPEEARQGLLDTIDSLEVPPLNTFVIRASGEPL